MNHLKQALQATMRSSSPPTMYLPKAIITDVRIRDAYNSRVAVTERSYNVDCVPVG